MHRLHAHHMQTDMLVSEGVNLLNILLDAAVRPTVRKFTTKIMFLLSGYRKGNNGTHTRGEIMAPTPGVK